MTGFLQLARDALVLQYEKFRNRDFLEATMAASALVATADGEVNITELSMLDQALSAIHELNIYDPHEAVDLYRDYVDALKEDPRAAREKILDSVRELEDDKHAATLLIRVCVAIAKSDDVLTDGEHQAIALLCDTMNLPLERAGV